jgi:DNA helicase INO80
MSFASILSEPAEEPASRRSLSPQPRRPATHPNGPEPTPVTPLPQLEKKNSEEKRDRTPDDKENTPSLPLANGSIEPSKPDSQPRAVKPRRMPTDKDLEAIDKLVAEIDKTEKSDVDEPGFEQELERYLVRSRKRAMEADRLDSHKRKVCSRTPVTVFFTDWFAATS